MAAAGAAAVAVWQQWACVCARRCQDLHAAERRNFRELIITQKHVCWPAGAQARTFATMDRIVLLLCLVCSDHRCSRERRSLLRPSLLCCVFPRSANVSRFKNLTGVWEPGAGCSCCSGQGWQVITPSDASDTKEFTQGPRVHCRWQSAAVAAHVFVHGLDGRDERKVQEVCGDGGCLRSAMNT